MLSELDLSLGALEIGILLSSVLWGVTTIQVYIYVTTSNKDPLWTKAIVYLVWSLESFHTIFIWIYLYRLTVTFYGIPTVLEKTHWTLDTSSFFDGIIGTMVQMFFAYRIRAFSKSWSITLISWTGALLNLACTMGVTILSESLSLPVTVFTARFGWIIEASLTLSLIVDIINTTMFSYHLFRQRTGFKGTDVVLEKLVSWTMETGLVTMIAAAVELIFFKVTSSTALWIAVSFFSAKLYSNSLLAILNSRSLIARSLPVSAQTDTNVVRSWSGTQSGVLVTVVQGREDIELGSIKRMNDSERNPQCL
ncbi:hypothetical protein B0H15DRAFT_889337 [Mycena belliarum]|uniref:DUF6534 domain-containing protein n=1 Tax=Mycena belliarum TaxID=1033014 RepID=A0AAD6U1X4_9AGAR|nr:hypothetical protein B0H15DRAFT_889337 [Mycena belliae]